MNIEVKELGQVSSGSMGDITVAEGPSTLGYQAFAFKGTAASYIDLRVPATTPLNMDCTFLFYVYRETTTDGVLFQFESDDVSTSDALTGIDVTFDNSSIQFRFTGNSSTWSSGSDQIPNEIPTGRLRISWGFGCWRFTSGPEVQL